MLEKFAFLIINQTPSSILSPYSAIIFKVFFPKLFTFKGIYGIGLINECYRSIIQKPILTRAGKITKKVFLHAGFKRVKCSVLVFIISQSKSETAFLSCDSINADK